MNNYQVAIVEYDRSDFKPSQWTENPSEGKFVGNWEFVLEKLKLEHLRVYNLNDYEVCKEFTQGFNEEEIEYKSGYWALIVDEKQKLLSGDKVSVKNNYLYN